jgi:hypothetical protein
MGVDTGTKQQFWSPEQNNQKPAAQTAADNDLDDLDEIEDV